MMIAYFEWVFQYNDDVNPRDKQIILWTGVK